MAFGDIGFYANAHILVKAVGFFGTTASKVDEWACSWKFPLDDTFTISEAQLGALLETIATPVLTFHTHIGVEAGTQCFLEKLTAAIIDTRGLYFTSLQNTVEHVFGTPVAGASTTTKPYSTAVKYTHFSEFPRGKASRGGVFYPATGLGVTNVTGAINDVTSKVTRYQTLINAMNQATDGIADASSLGILGQDTTHLPKGSPARTGIVLEIGVGAAPDTQRRRDNKIPEAHTRAAVVPHFTDAVAGRFERRGVMTNRPSA